MAPFTLFLLAFWIFDHGVTALQLPWWVGRAGKGLSSTSRQACCCYSCNPPSCACIQRCSFFCVKVCTRCFLTPPQGVQLAPARGAGRRQGHSQQWHCEGRGMSEPG